MEFSAHQLWLELATRTSVLSDKLTGNFSLVFCAFQLSCCWKTGLYELELLPNLCCIIVWFWCCFMFQGYYGCAIGKGKQAAKTEIEKIKVSLLSR